MTPAIAAPVTPGLQAVASSDRMVRGSGHVIDDRRAIDGFRAIRVSGPIDVELRAADRDSVTVRADDNIVALIETRLVQGDRPALEIALAEDAAFRTRHTPRVLVEFRAVAEIVSQGSGKLTADRIQADDLALSVSGSGDVRIRTMRAKLFAAVLAGSGELSVQGEADQQAFRLSGSGDVAAGRLVGRSVKVAIAGSGDASVHATEELQVSIAGSGDVVYRGAPRISQRIQGSGTVRKAH